MVRLYLSISVCQYCKYVVFQRTENCQELCLTVQIEKKWIENWIKKNWQNSKKEPVKNKELWQELYGLTKTHDVTFNKVKGHADNEFNNRCDEMAVTESKKFTK